MPSSPVKPIPTDIGSYLWILFWVIVIIGVVVGFITGNWWLGGGIILAGIVITVILAALPLFIK